MREDILRNFGKVVSKSDLKKDINVRRIEFKKIIQSNLNNPMAKRYGLEFTSNASLIHSDAKKLIAAGGYFQQRQDSGLSHLPDMVLQPKLAEKNSPFLPSLLSKPTIAASVYDDNILTKLSPSNSNIHNLAPNYYQQKAILNQSSSVMV